MNALNDCLKYDSTSIDISIEKDLKRSIQVGEDLLNKLIQRNNPKTKPYEGYDLEGSVEMVSYVMQNFCRWVHILTF